MQETWRPTLQRVMASDGGNRVVAASPSLPGVVHPVSVASAVATATLVLAVTPMVTAEASLEVSLAAPPPSVVAEEERETELPASPGGGLHGSPSRSELKALGGDVAGAESERPAVARANGVVEILSDDEVDDTVELSMSSWELAVV